MAIWIPADEKDGEPQLLDDAVRLSVVKEEKFAKSTATSENYETEEYLLLVEPEERSVTGRYLKSATTDIDPQGKLIVSFTFDQTGAFLFGDLTTRFNRPGRPDGEKRKLAIVLDRKVYSAPNLNEAITGGRGQISGWAAGGFTASGSGRTCRNVLNAGALEVPIDPKPLSEATVDPTLGADVRNKGVNATLISAAGSRDFHADLLSILRDRCRDFSDAESDPDAGSDGDDQCHVHAAGYCGYRVDDRDGGGCERSDL